MEQFILGIILALAVLFLFNRFSRVVQRKDSSCGAGGGGCSCCPNAGKED